MQVRKLRKQKDLYKIFVIDHMAVVLKHIASSLQNYSVQVYSDPNFALSDAKQIKPDLILMDFNLKGMTGFELCQKLQQDADTIEIPIIFLASFDEVDRAREAIDYGASDFIDKANLNPEIVQIRVENTLKFNEAMKQANALASETKKFLRVICHDVATPLSVVKSCGKIIQENTGDLDLGKRFTFAVSRLEKSANKIEDILDEVRQSYARAEKGETIPVENVPLGAVINSAIESLAEKVESKGLFLDIAPIEDSIQVIANANILENQVLGNLLNNAIKFTSTGGNITVFTEVFDHRVEISVVDSGVEMPSNLMAKIFDPTQVTSRPGTDNEKGTGLGLPIVKDFIEQMGGRISVSSNDINFESTDHGTTFKIELKRSVV